jgi:hypothetical protein
MTAASRTEGGTTMPERPVSSMSAFVSNWRNYDAPLITKLKLAIHNNLIKIRTHSHCCGHPGQPGC